MSESDRPERRNLLLRMLINEMLEQVRDMHRHAGPWAPDERSRAEETLERVMNQVRAEALRQSTE
ncbi:MAG: hypothetical protein ACT4P7_17125 [Gemmatimonadaceae bacterium]